MLDKACNVWLIITEHVWLRIGFLSLTFVKNAYVIIHSVVTRKFRVVITISEVAANVAMVTTTRTLGG